MALGYLHAELQKRISASLPYLLMQAGIEGAPMEVGAYQKIDRALLDTRPAEVYADGVFLTERWVIVVEIQNAIDAQKQGAWDTYMSLLQREYRRPILLLIITPKKKVYQWAVAVKKRIERAWGQVTVLGPQHFSADLPVELIEKHFEFASFVGALTRSPSLLMLLWTEMKRRYRGSLDRCD